MPFGMELGWRRGMPAAGGGSGVALTGTLAGAGAASLAALTIVTEQAETTALVARMTVAPSTTRRGLIDALIAGLKADGVWSKLDWLVVTAAHEPQAARLNWRAGKTLAAVNAPVFTVDRGYAGDGASAYLDLGEAVTAGGQYQRDGATLGVWVNSVTGTLGYQIGVAEGITGVNSLYLRNSSTASGSRINGGSQTGTTVARHVTGSRTASTGYRTYFEGGAAGGGTQVDTTAASVAVAGTACLLRAGTNYSGHRLAAAYLGAGLSDAEAAALHGRLNTFLTSIGAQ